MKKDAGGTVVDEALDATVLDRVTDAQPLARGASLGRYLVLELLGSGGMGVVYAAYDPELDRKVAVKLLRGDGGDGSSGRTRLLREAQAMARLADPNVIHVYDVGTIDDQVFVAMELVDGVTLRRWVEGRAPGEILQMYRQAGRGLAAAHAAGLVHRDFKPDNVLVGSDGRARVLDFGLARVAQEPIDEEARRTASPTALNTPLTRTGAFLGTPAYMAPEQLAGEPVDASCDQFAFCIALYEALCSERPFAGETINQLIDNIRAGQIREGARSISPSLRRALVRGLAATKEARHASMTALLDALAPEPSRRRVWLWAGAALTGLLLTIGYARMVRRPSCAGAAERFASVWSPAQQPVVHAAFAASGVGFAESTFATVSRALDDYGRAWSRERTDACEATQKRGDQSAQTLDLRMDCYDRQLREAAALVGAFASADSATVSHAVEALEHLPSVAECANVAALNAVQPPPKAQRAKVAALETEVARALALLDTGKHGPGQELAQATADAAKTLGYPPLSARALIALGRGEFALGHFAPSKDALLQAAWAADAGHDDADKVTAWSWLCFVVANGPIKPDEAHLYARNAEAALERLGEADPMLEAELRVDESQAFLVERKLPEALAQTQRAASILERAHRADTILWAQSVQARGYVLGELGRDEEAMADYQRARAAFGKLVGDEHPQITNLLADIGVYYFHKHDMERGLAIFQEVAARKERQVPINEPTLAVVYNNIAGALWELGRHAESLPYYRRVLALREKSLGPEHRKLVDPLTGIGDALLDQGKPAEALVPLERAIRIGEREKIPEDDLAEARFALAQVLWRTHGDRARARLLAAAARPGMVTLGDKEMLARLDAWLKSPK